MSYSISVKFNSISDKEKMYNFLFENQDLINQLSSDSFPLDILIDENISNYSPIEHKDVLIGFHKSKISSGMWDLCIWMSKKMNCLDSNNNYFIYYDDEKVNFFENNEIINPSLLYVNANGFRLKKTKLFDFFENKKVDNLLLQIDSNWENLNKRNTKKF